MSTRIRKRSFSLRILASASMIVAIGLAVRSAGAGRQAKHPLAESLAPIPTPLGISGRRLFRFDRGDCIVICPPIVPVSEDEQRRYRGTNEETDLVRLAPPADSRWSFDPNRPEQQTTFNCATFAIGDVIGLSRADFLDPRSVSFTNGQNPAHILLQEFYSCVASYALSTIDWKQLDRLESLRDDDVVVFATRGSNEEYVHLGRIAKIQGHNRMVSKMGRGPIVRGTIQRTAQDYEGRFNEIKIYRRL